MQKSLSTAIFISGLIVGTLDITFACIQVYVLNGTMPYRVLKYISSAIFGKEAYNGGTEMVVFGLLMHYFIAFSFTVFFFLIYPVIKNLITNKIILGILYGAFIWSIMNLIVLPLANVPQAPFVFNKVMMAMCILIVAIGLPLSYLANRFYNQE